MTKTQVKPNHYFADSYNTAERKRSFSLQIKLIEKTHPKSVLEIGIGNALVSQKLEKKGLSVTTLDIDKNLKPDIVADITKIPLPNNSFDTVAAFEVLEHLPFGKFLISLKQMRRVSKNFILFSVPDVTPRVHFLKKIFKKPKLIPHCFDGQHYWEIGKKNYQIKKIIKNIKICKLKIKNTFIDESVTNRRFFVLGKK